VGLFGKQPEPSKTYSAPVTPKSGSSPDASTTPTPNTLIGKEALITGEINTSQVMQIEGRVEGKIKSTGLVVIGEAGRVKAEIEAENVSIRGKLEGDCSAKNRIEITNTGNVLGNLRAPLIAVAEGAIFRGSSNMTDKEGPSKEKRPVESASSKPSGAAADELGPKLGPN
jgi:cytoskeletal protein CcmA (bactofilin family)